MSTREARDVGLWLAGWAVLVFAIVLVGGATRLTESGLSITEWKPISGVIPPLTDAQWLVEFEKYQLIPQYRLLNDGMSLASFKSIYLWEYWHRIIARLAGLAFVLPLAWFAMRRRIPSHASGRIYLLLGLLLTQASMGWWMVASGLSERTSVSQYRLAVHLTLAFVILALTVWTSADLLQGSRARGSALRDDALPGDALPGDARESDAREGDTPRADALRGWRARALPLLLGLVFLTSASGALVAGLRAGKIYNTYPLMGGQVMPPGYGQFAPWWRNLFDNPAAVQFNHRVLALTTFAAAIFIWTSFRGHTDERLTRRMNLVLAAALLQFVLGISTLLLAVPITLGVAHQGGAALLLTAVLLAWHASGGTATVPEHGRVLRPLVVKEHASA